MRPEGKRATVSTMAQKDSPTRLYRRVSLEASKINEILAGLLFGLASVHLTSPEQTTVLNRIDGLVRLKIDYGLLRGRRR